MRGIDFRATDAPADSAPDAAANTVPIFVSFEVPYFRYADNVSNPVANGSAHRLSYPFSNAYAHSTVSRMHASLQKNLYCRLVY